MVNGYEKIVYFYFILSILKNDPQILSLFLFFSSLICDISSYSICVTQINLWQFVWTIKKIDCVKCNFESALFIIFKTSNIKPEWKHAYQHNKKSMSWLVNWNQLVRNTLPAYLVKPGKNIELLSRSKGQEKVRKLSVLILPSFSPPLCEIRVYCDITEFLS